MALAKLKNCGQTLEYETLERFTQFREAGYQTFTRRATALLEVIDAVAQVARPTARPN